MTRCRPIIFDGESVRAIKRVYGNNEERRIHFDDAELVRMFTEGKTAAEMAVILGCSTHPVKRALRRLGLRRPAKPRAGVMAGKNNPQWKGGRRTRGDGYVVVWTPRGEMLEHRAVMEEILGRPLRPSEVVHHKDGNKSNNAPANLEVMSQSEHVRLHLDGMHRARYGS